jgi:FkbM family methyltransferase
MAYAENAASARKLFCDPLSLRVFDMRLSYGAGAGSNPNAIQEAVDFTGVSDAARSRVLRLVKEIRNPRRKKFIYGAGVGCQAALLHFAHALGVSDWQGIIDNNVTGERYGLPIVSFQEFAADHRTCQDALILNSIGLPAGAATHAQCLDAGMDCLSLFEIEFSHRQYFDLPKELGLVGDGEVFVQAGCFNGDTQKSYVNWFGDTYAKMVTFEAHPGQFAVSQERLAGLRDVEIVRAGLSDRRGTVRFALGTLGNSSIQQTGGEEINVVPLDEYMAGRRVTFIALDIEGAELAAIQGAKGIIVEQKPKLAISVYHRPEDIWEIPLLVKEYNPSYRFYLRHYHLLDMLETVMYAL